MEKKYVEGLFNNPKKDTQPDFVLGGVSFHGERFAKWLMENINDKGYVYFQILQGRDGGAYLKHNDWTPEKADAKRKDNRKKEIEEIGKNIPIEEIEF